jgi:hypothetical protein
MIDFVDYQIIKTRAMNIQLMKWENSTAKGMNFFIENSSNLISSILVD